MTVFFLFSYHARDVTTNAKIFAVPIPYITLKYHTIYQLLFLVLNSRLPSYFLRPIGHYLPCLPCV
jgi:hypothetical protein